MRGRTRGGDFAGQPRQRVRPQLLRLVLVVPPRVRIVLLARHCQADLPVAGWEHEREWEWEREREREQCAARSRDPTTVIVFGFSSFFFVVIVVVVRCSDELGGVGGVGTSIEYSEAI